jgi:hypothetical protein
VLRKETQHRHAEWYKGKRQIQTPYRFVKKQKVKQLATRNRLKGDGKNISRIY